MTYTDFLNHSLEWIQQSGWVGLLWFAVIYSLTSVTFLPASFLTLGAGALYGVWIGMPLVVLSSTLGAVISFAISRYLARNWMIRKLGHDARYRALERAVVTDGWKIILVSRISPVVPHTLISYAAGLTQISFWRFTFASAIGFIPLNLLYAYLGAVLGTAVTHHHLAPHDPLTWALYIVGSLATIATIVMMSRAATKAWKECLAEKADLV